MLNNLKTEEKNHKARICTKTHLVERQEIEERDAVAFESHQEVR